METEESKDAKIWYARLVVRAMGDEIVKYTKKSKSLAEEQLKEHLEVLADGQIQEEILEAYRLLANNPLQPSKTVL